MMEIDIFRFSDDGDSTLGLMFIDGAFFCYTLEDEFRPVKLKHETRIPAGTYELGIMDVITPMTQKYRARHNWFEFFTVLKDVPGFSHIYVHYGNTDEDTSGCILVGDAQKSNNSYGTGFVENSRDTFRQWYKIVYPQLQLGRTVKINLIDMDRNYDKFIQKLPL